MEIKVTGSYTLPILDRFKNIVTNEVSLQCDTSQSPVNIYLPKIEKLNSAYGIKIHINDEAENSGTHSITVHVHSADKINNGMTYVISENGASAILKITGQNDWLATGVGGGGAVAPINIEYAELYNAIVSETLKPGAKYRLTNYRSVNFLNGIEKARQDYGMMPTDSYNPTQIHQGETEIILLTAISASQLSPIAYSETFDGDIVHFEAFTNKIGIPINNGLYGGATLPDLSALSNFDLKWDGANVYFDMPEGYPALYGHYFYIYAEFDGGSYYQDGCFEPITPGVNIAQYPYTSNDVQYNYPKKMSRIKFENNGQKVILMDLTNDDFLNYDADSLYVDTVFALGDAYGWITRRIDTKRNIDCPFDFRGRKYRRFEVNLTPINSDLPTNYWGIGETFLGQVTTGNFKDFKIFATDGYDAWNIEWKDMGGPDAYWYRGHNDNNVFLGNFYNNTIGFASHTNTLNYIVRNILGDYFSYNVIDYCHENTFGKFNYSNIMSGQFAHNTIGNNFDSNIIKQGFRYNNIGDSFGSNNVGFNFRYNIIASLFSGNFIANNFYYNNIGVAFQANNVGNDFNSNTVGNDCFSNTILHDCFYNIIGHFFRNNNLSYSFTKNKVGNDFYNNTIGYGCNFNDFKNGFLFITAGNNLRLNTFEARISSVNLNSATHVYGDYNCIIFKRPDGTLKLSYYDNSDVLTIVNPTA
jgi:hypothetical protein